MTEKPQTAEELLAEVLRELEPVFGCEARFRPGLQAARGVIKVKWPRWIVARDEQIQSETRRQQMEECEEHICSMHEEKYVAIRRAAMEEAVRAVRTLDDPMYQHEVEQAIREAFRLEER